PAGVRGHRLRDPRHPRDRQSRRAGDQGPHPRSRGVMTTAGRKPVLRAIEGGLSKVPAPPKGLGPEAHQEWRRAAQELIDRKVLAKSDLPALEAYSVAYAMMRKLQPIAAKADPLLFNERTGAIKKHPAHVQLQAYLNLVLRYQS